MTSAGFFVVIRNKLFLVSLKYYILTVMDKKSKYFFAFLVALISVAILATFYRFFILADFEPYYDDYDETIES